MPVQYKLQHLQAPPQQHLHLCPPPRISSLMPAFCLRSALRLGSRANLRRHGRQAISSATLGLRPLPPDILRHPNAVRTTLEHVYYPTAGRLCT